MQLFRLLESRSYSNDISVSLSFIYFLSAVLLTSGPCLCIQVYIFDIFLVFLLHLAFEKMSSTIMVQ